MKKFTVISVNRLVIGDRFYKVNDKKKKVLELVQGEVLITKFRVYGFFYKTDNDNTPKPIVGSTKVVFLRHNDAVPLPPTNRKILRYAVRIITPEQMQLKQTKKPQLL